MKNRNGRFGSLVAFVCIFVLQAAYAQDEKKQPDAYSAVAVGTGGSAGGKSIPFDFRITSYTTDEEVDRFAARLKEKGQDALRNTLEKEDRGRVNPVGSVGNQIAVARKRQQGTETIITIVTARVMSFTELYNRGRSRDYPFGYLQVKLNDKGEGRDRSWLPPRLSSTRRAATMKLKVTVINTSRRSTCDLRNRRETVSRGHNLQRVKQSSNLSRFRSDLSCLTNTP